MGSQPTHKAAFSWVENGPGGQEIRDGEQLVAAFYPGTDTLPANPRAALRPISLHNLRLTSRGPVMIERGEICGPLCLSWRKHLMFNMEIDQLEVDDSDPERLTLYVRSHDTALRADQPNQDAYLPGNVTEETWLELTYDAKLASYVYDIRTQLTATRGREEAVIARDLRGLEFGDILPAGANDAFPPEGSKKYTHIVYRATDGKLYNRPQNKHLGPDKADMLYAPNGIVAFVCEAGGNPVLEFLDGTGAMARSEICWAMYDLHLKSRPQESRSRVRDGEPLEFHYRLHSLPQEQAAALLAESAPDPVLDHAMVRCPVFDGPGTNHFAPSREYRQPSDKWFWQCSDPGCRWDWETGCTTPGSLMMVREVDPQKPLSPDAPWANAHGGALDNARTSYWLFPRLPGNGALHIAAKILTENVEGKAYVALYGRQDSHGEGAAGAASVLIASEPISGTYDWTDVVLNASDLPWKPNGLLLVLEGTGRCWFDEVSVNS